MYQLEKSTFGDHTLYKVYNGNRQNSFSLIPTFGNHLVELILDGKSLLDAYKEPEALVKGTWYKNSFLFPFPNRLKDGAYQFNGSNYQFPLNEPATQTALHGFGRTVAFELKEVILKETTAELICSYSDKGDKRAYPFPFDLEISMQLSDETGLTINMKVENRGEGAMPIGLGWHPYFSFGEPVDQLKLQLPPCHRIEIDNRMIPTGATSSFEAFNVLKSIDSSNLDTAFQLQPHASDRVEAMIEGRIGRLVYWQETGTGKYNFLQVFTPPNRKSIALEPMSCNINAFNNGSGLSVLEKGESMSGAFGVSFKSS